jgi:phospholipase C
VRWAPVIAVAALSVVGCSADDLSYLQRESWGFESIDSMSTPPDDPSLGCGASIPSDDKANARAACEFGSGARVLETLGIPRSTLATIPIRHVIVLMKENRSFDHLLGKLHDGGQPGVEAVPTDYSNPTATGSAVFPFHSTTTCIPYNPEHQSAAVQRCIDNGKMDGFVRNAAASTPSDGSFVMSYYDQNDLPFYYWLATTFAIADRHFPPMASGTFSNRNYMMFGTNAGVVDTGIVFPSPRTPSIFQLLINAGFTWGVYTDGTPLSGTLGWTGGSPGVHSLTDLYDALDAGTLPNVAFVDGIERVEDDEPTADLQRGEAWVKTLYDHAVASPQWPRLAILWTYDEAGAFADHVPPPTGCRANATSYPLSEMGPRVPLVVISPWAKRNYVSHVVHDHTALTRFIEALFDLPALTARDANSDALFDMFDFSCGRDLSIPGALAPGTGLCPNPPPPAG